MNAGGQPAHAATDLADVAATFTPLGQRAFARGEKLVAQGILPAHVMWDADEVLWDWLMFVADLSVRLPRMLLSRNMTHREFILPKPGVLELAAGMAHAATATGADPRMRIWTDGYPWRLWRIAQDVPLLARLTGVDEDIPAAYANADNIFCRGDYLSAMNTLRAAETRRTWRDALSDDARGVLDAHFAKGVADSTLKLPELAAPANKFAFGETRFLVDNTARNVERFVAAGRSGVVVTANAPRIGFRAVPNTVWRRAAWRMREEVTHDALAIADALTALNAEAAGTLRTIAGERPDALDVRAPFVVEIPSERINTEWIDPRRTLKRSFRSGFADQENA